MRGDTVIDKIWGFRVQVQQGLYGISGRSLLLCSVARLPILGPLAEDDLSCDP